MRVLRSKHTPAHLLARSLSRVLGTRLAASLLSHTFLCELLCSSSFCGLCSCLLQGAGGSSLSCERCCTCLISCQRRRLLGLLCWLRARVLLLLLLLHLRQSTLQGARAQHSKSGRLSTAQLRTLSQSAIGGGSTSWCMSRQACSQ